MDRPFAGRRKRRPGRPVWRPDRITLWHPGRVTLWHPGFGFCEGPRVHKMESIKRGAPDGGGRGAVWRTFHADAEISGGDPY